MKLFFFSIVSIDQTHYYYDKKNSTSGFVKRTRPAQQLSATATALIADLEDFDDDNEDAVVEANDDDADADEEDDENEDNNDDDKEESHDAKRRRKNDN